MESTSSKQLFASLLIVLAICSYMNSSSAAASVEISVKLFSQAANRLGVLVVTAVLHAVLYLLLFVV